MKGKRIFFRRREVWWIGASECRSAGWSDPKQVITTGGKVIIHIEHPVTPPYPPPHATPHPHHTLRHIPRYPSHHVTPTGTTLYATLHATLRATPNYHTPPPRPITTPTTPPYSTPNHHTSRLLHPRARALSPIAFNLIFEPNFKDFSGFLVLLGRF